ncbi:MAG TPA: phosphatidylglycerophosphatase A [Kofleriaceae bacterium]|jgi:phosphatidylglycerophosphatase A
MDRLAKLVATACGAGYSPIAPGTCGTLVTIPLAFALRNAPLWLFALVTIAIILVGVWAADRADRAWGTHDSGRIVIDEVAGYLVTVALVDRASWLVLLVGFVIFRALDITKPPPIRWLDENLPGGWGVVLDDVAAGVLGCVIMVALAHFSVFARLAGL